MTLIIPVRLSAIGNHIEKRYIYDETFREVYNDYLSYLDAHRFWSQNTMDVAHARRREYAQLVIELEEELIQILKKGEIS